MISFCKSWFKDQALPLWLEKGFDPVTGSFAECLSFVDATSVEEKPRRAMVQARQLYVINQAHLLSLFPAEKSLECIEKGVTHFLNHYVRPEGGVYHSLAQDFSVVDERPDLYGQAFALFGLAQAYEALKNPVYLESAQALLNYLRKERAVAGGGFTELSSGGELIYSSNPHMHLLESALAWMRVDHHPCWRELAFELVSLCLNKFVDNETGLIGEHFDSGWKVQRNKEGLFMFEPGHQYEWSWLMGEYQKLTGEDLYQQRLDIYLRAEERGIDPKNRFVYDEVLSDFTPQKTSSRFWPQCERVKVALQLGLETKDEELKKNCVVAADEALEKLICFLETPVRGLWYDTLKPDGEFEVIPAKGSSFYHIVGAFSEYIRLRGLF